MYGSCDLNADVTQREIACANARRAYILKCRQNLTPYLFLNSQNFHPTNLNKINCIPCELCNPLRYNSYDIFLPQVIKKSGYIVIVGDDNINPLPEFLRNVNYHPKSNYCNRYWDRFGYQVSFAEEQPNPDDPFATPMWTFTNLRLGNNVGLPNEHAVGNTSMQIELTFKS